MTAVRKAFGGTEVPAARSQQQIEDLLRKHDVEAIRWTMLGERIVLEFKLPDGSFALSVRYDVGDARTDDARRRQVLRALAWHLKAKFDAIDFGLEDVMRAFMPYLITAPNRTLGDDVVEAVEQRRLGAEIPLLPAGSVQP